MMKLLSTEKCAKGMQVLIVFLLMVFIASCSRRQVNSPAGYDLSQPVRFEMNHSLKEISGITFNKGISGTMYAVEDENGLLYCFNPGSKELKSLKFGKKGDYEDVAICNRYVIVLRSDGTLFSFPFTETGNEKAAGVFEFDNLVTGGEFEGLYADESTNKLYVLCKNCGKEKVNGFILQLNDDGTIAAAGNFNINENEIEALLNGKKITFHPSALTKNTETNEWYIISSVNKLLVVADDNWKIKEVYELNAEQFSQPEGITFDSDNNLYISNEGNEFGKATVLKFQFIKN